MKQKIKGFFYTRVSLYKALTWFPIGVLFGWLISSNIR